jgi:hypothetical protein
MTKITINNKDLISTQNTTWDRMDTTYAVENEVAGSFDPGMPRLNTPSDSCKECNITLQIGWNYCPHCGRMS